jgi:transcriptional regulator of met regulon
VKLSLDLGGSSPVVFYALHGAEDEAMEQVRRMLLELQVEVLPCVVDLTTRQVEPLREADPSEGEGEESP